ncbi:hypothetical protein SAY87_007526 [Trapa incisa]|uniref:Uncharacterized protein n=1 Tax=Trapa incisa TaxID=236973 RepID=A0AAN7KIR1_9MYRT|nr:hypothetical protein SAY87_007526 [Trapa incisa]
MILEAKSYGHAEEQCPVVFSECMARIPNGNISNGTTGTSILSKGKDTVSNEKAQIRASSVPRPRAILSSPDNDAAIGKKNRNATAQSSALRNQNKLQARNAHQQLMDKTKKDVDIDAHLKRTVSVETVNINGPGSKRKPKAPSDIKSRHPTQSQQDVLLTKARPYLRAGKPNAARFLV